jgi:hypothetical protein
VNRCPQAERIAEAARTRRWSDALRAHAAACPDCADLALVAGALAADARRLARTPARRPDPAAIWRRAQFDLREQQARRATALIAWMQRTALAALVALAILVVTGSGRWGGVRSAVIEWLPSSRLAETPAPVSIAVLVAVLTMVALALAALVSEVAERRAVQKG